MKKNQLAVIGVVAFLLSGCSVGYMTSYNADPIFATIKRTDYSPLFSTGTLPLSEGAAFRVSVTITRRVEPISYGLLTLMKKSTQDNTLSESAAVIHFINDSQQIYRIKLLKLVILKKNYPIKAPVIILKPGQRFDAGSFTVKAPTYDTSFDGELFYELDRVFTSKELFLRRKTMGEFRERKRTVNQEDAKI